MVKMSELLDMLGISEMANMTKILRMLEMMEMLEMLVMLMELAELKCSLELELELRNRTAFGQSSAKKVTAVTHGCPARFTSGWLDLWVDAYMYAQLPTPQLNTPCELHTASEPGSFGYTFELLSLPIHDRSW